MESILAVRVDGNRVIVHSKRFKDSVSFVVDLSNIPKKAGEMVETRLTALLAR